MNWTKQAVDDGGDELAACDEEIVDDYQTTTQMARRTFSNVDRYRHRSTA